MLFAGDFEVVGPDPTLGLEEVRGLGVDLVLLHFHHRHEYAGGRPRGLWGLVEERPGKRRWEEVDRLVVEAKRRFRAVGLYPVGWAHMVPAHRGETILDVEPDVVGRWVAEVVSRYVGMVDVFPIFYEMNVFDLFYRTTHKRAYGREEKEHVVRCLRAAYERVVQEVGAAVTQKLTASTFVELTESAFYWMSEGSLLELPKGSAMLECPLSPPDLLETAAKLDEEGPQGHGEAVAALLRQIIFWNADDSGAAELLGDSLRRIVEAGWIKEGGGREAGFVERIVAGWDAQPQNTYEYLVKRLRPEAQVASTDECLRAHFASFAEFLADENVPEAARRSVCGFVLDDAFKCTKQTGITSAVVPERECKGSDGQRVASGSGVVTALGETYAELILAWREGGPERLVSV